MMGSHLDPEPAHFLPARSVMLMLMSEGMRFLCSFSRNRRMISENPEIGKICQTVANEVDSPAKVQVCAFAGGSEIPTLKRICTDRLVCRVSLASARHIACLPHHRVNAISTLL